MFLLLFVLAFSYGEELAAYDCSAPTSSRFLAHHHCLKEDAHHSHEKYTVAQFNTRKNVTGVRCAIRMTAQVGYCGHYSATKLTDQSAYNVPVEVSIDDCSKMATSLTYQSGGVLHTLRMNQLNRVKFFTHGSISYDGSNIHCNGQPMRLANGKVNQHMLRVVHLQIKLQQVGLKVDDNAVYTAEGHYLGPATQLGGRDDLETVVWPSSASVGCNIGAIGAMTFTTSNGNILTNAEHMVQIVKKRNVYHEGCRVSYFETSAPGILLLKKGMMGKVNKANSMSTRVASHFQSQIDFLGAQLLKQMRDSYQLRYDPECRLMGASQLHRTVALPSHRFYRNLGDVSVIFSCKDVKVKPRITDERRCYVQPPVSSPDGTPMFLDPETRILLHTGTEVRCSSATAPILKTVTGGFVAFTPDEKIIKPDAADNSDAEDKLDSEVDHGLYSAEVVEDWLSSAYLEHIHQTLTVGGGEGGLVPIPTMVNGIRSTYQEMLTTAKANIGFLGLDWNWLGNKCALVLMILLVVYSLYWVLELTLKFLMVLETEKRIMHALFRTCFSGLFLMAEETARKLRPENAPATWENGNHA